MLHQDRANFEVYLSCLTSEQFSRDVLLETKNMDNPQNYSSNLPLLNTQKKNNRFDSLWVLSFDRTLNNLYVYVRPVTIACSIL